MHITAQKLSINSGDDMAGTIHAIGSSASSTGEFKIGASLSIWRAV
jgi:hypothetical protein